MLEQYENCVSYFRNIILDKIKMGEDCWVAGGALRDYFSLGYITKDVDLWFPHIEAVKYANDWFKKSKAHLIVETDNAYKYRLGKRTFDVIKKCFDSPQKTIDAFDFTVCCCAVNCNHVWHHPSFFIDLAKKRLVINSIESKPLSTLRRMYKYTQKGYTCCNGALLKIAKAVSEVDFTNPKQNIFEFYPDGKEKHIRYS